ncbi:isocitrate lyase [Sarracenia purpurea var. burkii]
MERGASGAHIEDQSSVLPEAKANGKSGLELQSIEDDWMSKAQPKTFSNCVLDAMKHMNVPEAEKRQKLDEWMAHSSFDKCLPNKKGREIVERLGVQNLFWDWDLPRTREGFYRFRCSVDAAIVRGWAFAPHADLIWKETASLDMVECTIFVQGVIGLGLWMAVRLSTLGDFTSLRRLLDLTHKKSSSKLT